MGCRLTQIHTRTGDQGITGLGGGVRLPKSSLRICALGDLDEFNCALGVLLATDLPAPLAQTIESSLVGLQHDLLDLGAELAFPGRVRLAEGRLLSVEHTLESINAELPPLRGFILPGGSPAGATCHLARAVARRAERSLVALSEVEVVNPLAIRYLNRVSDLLFVLARALNHGANRPDVVWEPQGAQS